MAITINKQTIDQSVYENHEASEVDSPAKPYSKGKIFRSIIGEQEAVDDA